MPKRTAIFSMHSKPPGTKVDLGGFTSLRVYFVDLPPQVSGGGWYWGIGRTHYGPFKDEPTAKRDALVTIPGLLELASATMQRLKA